MKMTIGKIWKYFMKASAVIVFGLGMFVCDSLAGEWQVSPTRITFTKETKSSIITVKNVSKEPITITANAMEWTQDDFGKDQYSPTKDLVFFPKVVVVKPGESRVIRLGVRVPAVKTEKSYRFFIKEEPSPQAAKNRTVAVVMQFAIPVFSKPLQEEFKWNYEDVAYVEGVLSFLLTNSGNVYFRTADVTYSGRNKEGDEIFQGQITENSYLLSGSTRKLSFYLSADRCAAIHTLQINVSTDPEPLTKSIELNQDMCSSP